MHRLFATMLLLPTLACMDPFSPEGANQFFPKSHSWYADQLREVATCIGIVIDPKVIEKIKWYIVPGDSIWTKERGWAAAANQDNRIYIASRWLLAKWVIKHELAHVLTGHNGHPLDPFRKCQLMNDQQHLSFQNIVID